MSLLISFYGSPGAGKTTLAMKAAMEMYMTSEKELKMVFVTPDITVPGVALLFPNLDPDEIFSLSGVLDRPEITPEIVLRNVVNTPSMKNFCVLGFKAGDTRFSFPPAGAGKISDLFSSLSEIADVIFVDCSDDYDDLISAYALENSDCIFRVISADIRGAAWVTSDTAFNDSMNIYNVVVDHSPDVMLPIEEACNCISPVTAVIPYSVPVRQQLLDGTLCERCRDRKYIHKVHQMISHIPWEKLNE